MRKKIKKYVEFILTKIIITFREKHFLYKREKVKYLLYKNRKSDSLVVIFSACTRPGLKARYNYVKTLSGMNCNRLYILDYWGNDGRGSFYLGKNGEYSEESATKALIDKIIRETGAKKLIFCGSSKGGYAAMNFGTEYKDSYIVFGGPQYFLADYIRGFNHLLEYILGEVNEESYKSLNCRLGNKIKNNANISSQKWFIHYSDKEHTYSEHIQYLIKDLNDNDYKLVEDVAHYSDHGEISYYFPDYLKSTINSIILE